MPSAATISTTSRLPYTYLRCYRELPAYRREKIIDVTEAFHAAVFDAADVIVAKRDKQELYDPQIDWVIDAYTRGAVADEQM